MTVRKHPDPVGLSSRAGRGLDAHVRRLDECTTPSRKQPCRNLARTREPQDRPGGEDYRAIDNDDTPILGSPRRSEGRRVRHRSVVRPAGTGLLEQRGDRKAPVSCGRRRRDGVTSAREGVQHVDERRSSRDRMVSHGHRSGHGVPGSHHNDQLPITARPPSSTFGAAAIRTNGQTPL